MKKKSIFISIILLIISINNTLGQISTPRLSPHCVITQEVGFNEITIDYCRPSVKGRVIFGDVVPFGKIWRTGANASTKLKFKDEVTIEGKEVPAGEYTLYTIPEKDEWTIILHTVNTYWGVGKDYKETDDFMRFKVKSTILNHKIETMAIELSDITNNSCYIEIKWDNTLVKFNISTEVEKKVLAEIEDKMKGVSQATYYQAAVYYLENGKDLSKALEWINKSLENNEKFWILRQKSLILAKLGKINEAIEIAEKSKKLALEQNNDEYVILNEKSILEWKAKKK